MSKFKVWIDIPQTQILTESEFASNDQRIEGFKPQTVISSVMMNSILRQSSLVTVALMDAINASEELNLSSSVEQVKNAILASFVTNLNLQNGSADYSLQQKLNLQYEQFSTSDNVNIAVNNVVRSAGVFANYSASFGTANLIKASTSNPTMSNSFAFGYGNTVDHSYSVVFGRANYLASLASNSIVAGSQNYLQGSYGAIFGQSNDSRSNKTFIQGAQNKIESDALNSVIFGTSNTVSQNTHYCFIFGSSNTVSASLGASNRSMLVGQTLRANRANSYMFGYNQTNYTGDRAFMFGTGNSIGTSSSSETHYNVIMLGESCKSPKGSRSVITGYLNTNYGDYNYLGGYNNTCFNSGSAIFGAANQSSANFNFTSGRQLTNPYEFCAMFGTYNDPISASGTATPILVVGYGTSDTNRKNAMVLTRAGKLSVNQLSVNGSDIPLPPTTVGTYTLKAVVNSNGTTYTWVNG